MFKALAVSALSCFLLAGSAQANQNPDFPGRTQARTAMEPVSRVKLAPDEIIHPSRLFFSQTGTILPSMAIHASGGAGFGFSDNRRSTDRWQLSFGLGGLGEASVSTHRIVHLTLPQSNALVGLRLKIPLERLHEGLGKHVKVALNLASTDKNQIDSNEEVPLANGESILAVRYQHRETTAGMATTLDFGPARLHGLMHLTDLRAEDISFQATTAMPDQEQQQVEFLSYGVGADMFANEKTIILAEVSTTPQLSLDETGNFSVSHHTQYGVGVRFFPNPAIALDASVTLDDEAIGLADAQIGFGLHVMLLPTKVKA